MTDTDTAYGYTFDAWLRAAGRSDSASEYDLRAAWRAGEDPADYSHDDPAPDSRRTRDADAYLERWKEDRHREYEGD